ncbi:hypothetical protein [Psychrobacillus sp. FJAT-21963]|nr:hypothetical protein [Psychrobacillus sp. FJAT-21963]
MMTKNQINESEQLEMLTIEKLVPKDPLEHGSCLMQVENVS